MVFLKPGDLMLLRGGAIEARRLHRHRQASRGDHRLADLSVESPLDQRIPIGEAIVFDEVVTATICRAGIEADRFDHLAAVLPTESSWLPSEDKFVLRRLLVLDRATL